MYFHAGQDFVLNTRSVVGIFDLDTAGASRRTQGFFRAAEHAGAVVDLCAGGTVPRGFVVLAAPTRAVYLSPLSARTLKKRAEEGRLETPAAPRPAP